MNSRTLQRTCKSVATFASVAVAFVTALAAIPSQAQENYGQWSKYRSLTLNTTAANGGANVNGTVTGVPVLVRLTSAQADVFAGALTGGADIRFTKSDGMTRLPHETQNWNAAGQTATFWVRVDTVRSVDSTQAIRMYWGKSGAADSSSSVSVFRTADGYQGVWHLEGAYNDATANANNGTNTGTLDTAGAMGRGRWFNGTSNSISIPNTATMNAANPLSVEAWVKWQGIGTGATDRYRPVINHGNANGGDQFFLYARNPSSGGSASYYSFGYYTGSATNDAQYATNVPADASNWVHLTGAYNGTTWFLYRNGVLVSSAARTGTPVNATTPWYIGAFGGASTSRYFFGSLDEIRFSSVVRDSNWIRLSYETQKAGATALAIGASQSTAPSNLSYLADPANYVTTIPITPNTATVTGTVDSFMVSPALPAGLALDKNTGTISGTPTMATATANYVVTAINAAGSTTDTISITVNAALPAAPTIAYATTSETYNVGTPIATITPTLGGGAADSIIVSPALPAGLALNKTNGVVSGTPTAVTASASYVFTAKNLGGEALDTITISVLPAAPTNLVYPVQVATYVVGEPAATNTPTVSGAVDSFMVAPALPAGLSFNKTNGAISGTPTAAAAATNYVVSAVNAGGTATDTLSIAVDAAEVFSTWARHRTLFLNTSAAGANVAGTVTNFPVLVRLSGNDSIFTQSSGRGADLRFTKFGDLVRFKHQIESWDSVGRVAAVWVLMDTIKGATHSDAQVIRMHWSKTGATNLSNGASVFDTAKGFQAVWHFGEGTSDTAFDATHNKFKGAPQRTVNTIEFPKDTTGTVGRARYFGAGGGTVNSSGSYFSVPNSATGPLNFPENGTYTVSTWANVDLVGTSRTLFSKSDKAYSLELRNTGADWEFAEFSAGSGWNVVNQAGAVAQTWVHLVGVRNGPTSLLYVDGVLIDAEVRLDASTAARRVVDFEIGRSPDGGTSNAARYYWRGMLDEVRLASVARSADWTKLEFENQKAAQTLVTLMPPPVGIGAAAARMGTQLSLAVKSLPGGVLFRLPGLTGTDFKSARLSLLDTRGRAVWNAAFTPGSNLVWNGMDEGGHPAPAGLYLVRVHLTDLAGKTHTLTARVPFTR